MANPWFRLYSRLMTDPKIEALAFEDQRHFIWVLCMKNEGFLDETFPTKEARERMIARKLGLQGEAFENTKKRLVEVGLLDKNWNPVRWDDLQFKSDGSTSRVRNYRERLKKSRSNENETLHETLHVTDGTVTVTAQDTDTDTDTDTENTSSPSSRTPACPHEDILALYHETLPTLTRHVVWSEARRKNLQARWRESAKRQHLDWWKTFFAHVAASDFLMGRTASRDGRPPFQADLEWLTKAGNFAKVVEGKYHA